MLQDRESYVTLLVGAKYGISQIINNKLNIMTTLAEFSNISRIELTPESDKVSLVKVYLQDVKPLSLLLESSNAKDIACLISGYCKLFVDSGGTIFIWPGNSHVHRVSTEEGYESRACSDSEESSEVESSLEPSSDLHFVKSNSIKPLHEEEEEEEEEEDEEECVPGFDQERQKKDSGVSERGCCDGRNNDTDSISEASDSANTESHGYKISWSSDSIDALEEDDLETCSSSRPEFFQFYTPCLKETIPEDQVVFNDSQELENKGNAIDKPDPLLCFLQMSNGRGDVEIDRKPQRDSECREENELPTYSAACQCLENNVMEYYSLCTNVSPASSTDRNVPSSPESSCVKGTQAQIMEKVGHQGLNHEVETLILEPPPGFGDSSSEEEFFDAADRFTPTLISSGAVSEYSQQLTRFHYPDNATSYTLQDPNVLMQNAQCKKQKYSKKPTKVLRKRRSFLQTDYTSQVTFPLSPSISSESMDHVCCNEKESHLFVDSHSPTVSSLKDTEGEPALLETKPLTKNKQVVEIKSRTHSPNLIEMEPDTMETKSVTDSVISSISAIRFRSDFEVEEVGQSGKQCQYSVDADNSLEQNGQTSPSQISLQMDEISIKGQSDLCLAARDFDSGSSNSYMKEGNILENSETERKTTLNNIFKNGCQDEGVGVHISLNSSRDPNDRQSLYIAKSEDEQVPSLQSLSKSDNCEKVDNQNSPENSTFDKSCHFIHANDFLFDFMGFDDIFTNFPVVCSGLNGPYHEEKEHLLGNTDSDVPCSDSHNMIQCSTDGMDTIVSSSLNSLQTALDTFDLCYAENESRDFDDLELKSKKSSCEYSPHTQRFFWEAQLRTQNQADSTNKGLDRNKDATSVENGTHIPYSSEQKIPVNIKSPSMSKLGNAGNCSCQLSYTSCFHSVDTEIDHETMDFGETEPSLPRTIPPVSENILSNERSNIGSGNSITLELCEALNRVRNVIQESPTGFGKIQDSVLDLQKFLEGYKNKVELHPQDKCAAYFSEHKSSLCSVSRKLMSSTQKVLDSDHSSAEMYQAVAETFFDLMQMTEVCLQFSTCAKCSRQHTDIQSNLQDLLCTYHQFVQAAKKASEQENGDLHFKLLSRQCTSLTAAVFCLTQQYRTLICL